MSSKLKALIFAALAAMAIGAIAVANAGAEGGGDFDLGDEHTIIKGFEDEETHFLEFTITGQSPIRCTNATYEGTQSGTTVDSITIAPKWSECYTTGSETKFDIDENGCHFTFTVGKEAEGDNTVHVGGCEEGATGIEITHPQCTVEVPEGTYNGASYDTVVENGVHAVTLTSTVENIEARFEAGFCVLLGTKHVAEMTGSVTVQGFDTENVPVDITATGTND